MFCTWGAHSYSATVSGTKMWWNGDGVVCSEVGEPGCMHHHVESGSRG